MSVAARYVNRELLAVFLVTLFMLLLVAVGGRFLGYLQEAAMGKFTGETVLMIILLRLPEFVQIVSPFAVYVALLLTFGRLYAEQEMIVLQNAGAGLQKLLFWAGITLLIVTALVASLSLYFTPMSQQKLSSFMAEVRSQTEFETVNPGMFHVYDRGRRVTYSSDMSENRRELYDVFLAQRMEDGRQATVWAEKGTQKIDEETGAHYLVLSDGHRYEGVPGSPQFRAVAFSELQQKLSSADLSGEVETEALPWLELGDDPEAQGEWHWRIGAPIFCLIGGLLAMGISRVKPREGRFTRVVPGTLILFLYYLSLMINRNLIAEGDVPAWIGLWLVHVVFAGYAVFNLNQLLKPVKT